MLPHKSDANGARVRHLESVVNSSLDHMNTPHSDGPTFRENENPTGALRSRGVRTANAEQLFVKMRRHTEARKQAAAKINRREEVIRMRYANAAAPFNRDDNLAELITENRGNFLRLDQELSTDHDIATHCLHTAVFSHATDFLHLFRDVNRASAMVQTLKGTVQGTKAAISAIGKFSMYGRGNTESDGGLSAAFSPLPLFSSGAGDTGHSGAHGVTRPARPSLITTHLVHADTRATTRSLNTPSVRLWRDTTLLEFNTQLGIPRSEVNTHANPATSTKKSNNAQDIALFADLLREEVSQVVAERRHLEAAELLRSVEAEAAENGCLPLVLALEESLVNAIASHLHSVPMPLMYSESLHVPLVQLLLRFGQLRSGSVAFFALHAAWLNDQMNKLQVRMDPQSGACIATDFLVCAVQEVLQRQENLWIAAGEDPSNKGDGSAVAQRPGNPALRIPPSSTAVLWVRDRIDKLAREVLGECALSYGAGAEGGDPSRFRGAVVMAADAIRTVRRMEDLGYPGCDTQLLRMLTPSLIYLQADFAACTGSRVESVGKTMMEHLIAAVGRFYDSNGASYAPRLAEDVARKNNHGCRELQHRLLGLPRTSFVLLLELFLAPASSSLFAGPLIHTNNNVANKNDLTSAGTLLPERYAFLRYANGCTRAHGLLLNAVIRFIAAMTGLDTLPSEQQEQQQKVKGAKVPPPPPTTTTTTNNNNNNTSGTSSPKTNAIVGSYESHRECASFIFSNALVTEFLDVTLQRLFLSFMRTALRQRQTLATHISSIKFINAHKKFNLACKASARRNGGKSPGWILEAMLLLLADVLSASSWIAFLACGGGIAQILCDSTITFRVRHLEELRRALPSLVQGWLSATLSFAYDMEVARDVLVGNAASLPSEKGLVVDLAEDRHVTGNFCTESIISDGAVAELEAAGKVNEGKMKPLLIDLACSRFTTNGTEAAMQQLFVAPASPVWSLRALLGNYPEFPIGDDFDHSDELFLFHWCTQITLNTLAFFQERLLTPSFVVNERWTSGKADGESQAELGKGSFPLCGFVSPHEESVLGALAAGGGNYTGAVGLLQFTVLRLLRDVFCRTDTWGVVYNLPLDKWRQSGKILRQQLFFFALFVRLWSPLFVGGTKTSSIAETTTTTTTSTATTTSPSARSDAANRTVLPNKMGNADRTPAMAPLQWLTCSTTARQYGIDLESLVFCSSAELANATTAAASATKNWRTERDVQHRDGSPSSPSSYAKGAGNTPANSTARQANSNSNAKVVTAEANMLLMGIVTHFFDALGEPRALPAMQSDVMRTRVERVMTAVNLMDFAGRNGLCETDSDDDDDDDSSRTSRSSLSSHTGTGAVTNADIPSKSKVTLQDVHDLLLHYVTPLL